jgi:hypothetical protein
VRRKTRLAGLSSRTATRMKRYGIPQITHIAEKSTQPRRVIAAFAPDAMAQRYAHGHDQGEPRLIALGCLTAPGGVVSLLSVYREDRLMARGDSSAARGGGIGLGGILVILGIILIITWSFWWGLIIGLVGLMFFGGFAKGRWY